LIFSGAIGTADPITALSVNGTVVTVATDGTFTADINAAWGVNFVDLVATDGAGLESRRTCSFLVSDRWAPDTTPLHDTVALKTAQSAVDDFSRGGAVNSFGDVFGLILASSQLRDAIHAAAIAVNPLKPSSCDQRIAILGFSQCVLSSEVTYVASQLGGPNTVSLQLVNGGVMARARIEDPALRLRVRGHAAGIPYDTTGWIRFDFIETDITFDFSIDGAGRPRATIRANSVATRVGSITTEFSGIDGFIINLMTSLANGTVRDLVANTVRSFLTSQFQPVLDGIVGGIRIANAPPTFAVDRLDGSPLDVNLAFMFSSLNTTSNRLLIGMGSRMSSSPAHARPAPGAPVPPGAILLDPTAGSGIASASNIALLNQGLFALWRGGFFDATLEGGSLRGVVPQDTAIQLSMAMPAAASLLAGERVGIDLGAVDLRVHAPAIWPTPFDVEGGARVSCAIRLADGDLPAESCTVDELHLSTAPAFDEATAAAVRELTGAVLMAVAERVANDAFPSLPAPAYQLPTSLLAYGLPAGASLGMSTPSLTTEGNHAVLRGPFALVVPLTGNPVPAIHHLSPASTHIGNTDQRLAVFGSGFNASSRVSFDGTELTPLVSSSTRLDVVVPAALLAIPRAVPVVVTNPEPGGGASNAVTFTISGVFVAGASPNRGPAGTVVVITGAGFSPDPAANHVSFNGVPAEVVAAAPATLETIVPPAATTGPLVVTTAAGSAAVPFTVTSAAQLLVSAVPAQAVYARGSAITIVTHFVDTDGVPIAGVPIDLVSTPPADARDGNTFTYLNDGIYTITATAVGVLINGAPVTASVQIRVGEVSRRLMCQTPFDGGLVTAPPGSSITLTGSVDLSQGLTGFFVNGTPVSVNATGGFSVAIATQWGLNFADLRLIDGAGAEVREICSFLLSSTWAPDTHQQANTVSLRLAQSAVDDVGRAGAAESLGDILHTVLNSAALADTLHNSLMASNPLKPLACDSFVSTIFGTVCFYSSEVRYVSSALPGPNTASLTLVDGGMRAQVRVEDAQLQMRVRGKVAGVSYDTTGTVFFDFVEVTAVFDTSLSAGRPRVQVRPGSVTASVGSITTNFSGLDGFVLDTIGTLFQGTLRNQVRSLVQNYVTNNFAATLDGIAGALEITTVPSSYAVPRLDGGEPLSVLFGVGVSALSTTPSRMLTSLSTRLFTVPTHGRPTFGAPIQIPFLLDPPSGGFPVASSVDTAVLNQALHALWRGGYFDAVLTGGALDGLVPEGTLVQIATGLPPAARLRADGRLEVAVGNVAMRVQDATIAPDPVDVEIGGRVSCELSFDGHAVADACTVDELHLRPLGPADSAVTTALEQYVPGPLAAILRTAANHSLPALPVPAYRIPASLATYGFPAGAELGLTEPAFSTDGQRFVLRGGFAIR
jgi:hypothetical protein